MNDKLFTTSFQWNTEVTFITIVTVLVTLGAIFYMFYSRSVPVWMKWVISIPVGAIFVYMTFLTPISLSLYPQELKIKKIVGSIVIPTEEITSISMVTNETNNSIRTFGSGGACGYLGKFKNDILGNYEMYATESNNLILVRTESKNYVFSCTNADILINDFNALKSK